MAVTYKSNKIVAQRIELILDFNSDGLLNIENSFVKFWSYRCLGGTDGKLSLGCSEVQTKDVPLQNIFTLDQALLAIYEDPDHLSSLCKLPLISAELLKVNAEEFVDPNPLEEF